MKEIRLEGLNPVVSERLSPFIKEVLDGHDENIHSMYIVGSSVTADFNEKTSDINSVVVLNKMDFGFIEFLSPMGKKYSKKRVAAPLILTPDYIRDSLDVFPIEFHDFRLIHRTVSGEDIFKDLRVDKEYLRLQCEREIKARLVGIRQGCISSLGEKERLAGMLLQSLRGVMPIIRAVVFLYGTEPPLLRRETVAKFHEMTGIEVDVFIKILALRDMTSKPSKEEILDIFHRYHDVLEQAGKIINEIQR